MKLYIDESGSITTNSSFENRFFVIVFLQTENPYHVIRQFRRAKVKFLKENPKFTMDVKKEIKGSQMPYEMKKYIFETIRDKTDAIFHFKVIDNHNTLPKLRTQSSLAFNYFVGLTVGNIHKKDTLSMDRELFMLIDERNQAVESLNSLDEYLKIKFTMENNFFDSVKTKYKDSGTKDLIQLADIFANTVYRICRTHANGGYDKKNRRLISSSNTGRKAYFPFRKCNLDICDK